MNNTIRLPAGTTHVFVESAADLIAEALWPDDVNTADVAFALLLDQMEQAVLDGVLTVRDSTTFAPHTFPVGRMFWRAVVSVGDLREWLHATRGMGVAVGDGPGSVASEPMQRSRSQEEAIVATLIELGFDPKALPTPSPGMASKAKGAVKAHLGYSHSVMRKAWQRLRSDGSISEA